MTKMRYDEAQMAQWMRSACQGNNADYKCFLNAAMLITRKIVEGKARGISAEDKEDIVQDVLLAIHDKRLTWRQDAPIKPWLYAIARYKIIDRFRKNGRASFVDIEPFSEIIAAEASEIGDQLDVEKLVRKLKGKQGEVVRMIGLESKSIADVAKELRMQENAVRVNFHRGLHKLRQFSGEEGEA